MSKENDNRITINVGGIRYQTYKSTLKNIPDTRLSWLSETRIQNCDYDESNKEYFFDRHPTIFLMVLNYYRTGKLHAPNDVCGPLFEEELNFWGLDENQIEPCCWMAYRTHRDAQDRLREFDEGVIEEEENFVIEDEVISKWTKCKCKIWALLEQPYSSNTAQIVAFISLLFIFLSILVLFFETHILFRVPTEDNNGTSTNPKWTIAQKNTLSKPHISLYIIEYICIIFFTFEVICKLIVTPDLKAFLKTPLLWIDILSIIPFLIEQLISTFTTTKQLTTSQIFQFLKIIRILRIIRIFKLNRHFSGLKILWHTLKASAKELVLLLVFLFLSCIVFSALVYYAESVDEPTDNDFNNIPIAFWWAAITLTTIGYGDRHPKTFLGYVVGIACALSGVLVLALPVPVIVNNFASYYAHAQAKLKLPRKQKKTLVGAADILKTSDTAAAAAVKDEESLLDKEGEAEERENEDNKSRDIFTVVFIDEKIVTDSSKTNYRQTGNGNKSKQTFRKNSIRPAIMNGRQHPANGSLGRRRSLLPYSK